MVKIIVLLKFKIMNKIQYTKIHKNHDVVFYIIVFLHCEQNNFFIQSGQIE